MRVTKKSPAKVDKKEMCSPPKNVSSPRKSSSGCSVGLKSTKSPNKEPNAADYECPICMYIMIEPVSLPCTHELCLRCFKDNYNQTSSTCPLCRTRIAVWSRHASKTNTLVNMEKWQLIQKHFPNAVKLAQGQDVQENEIDAVEPTAPVHVLSEAGAIGEEYQYELKKIEEEKRKRDAEEEAKSAELIKSLQESEAAGSAALSSDAFLDPMESEALWYKRKEDEEATRRLIEQLQREEAVNLDSSVEEGWPSAWTQASSALATSTSASSQKGSNDAQQQLQTGAVKLSNSGTISKQPTMKDALAAGFFDAKKSSKHNHHRHHHHHKRKHSDSEMKSCDSKVPRMDVNDLSVQDDSTDDESRNLIAQIMMNDQIDLDDSSDESYMSTDSSSRLRQDLFRKITSSSSAASVGSRKPWYQNSGTNQAAAAAGSSQAAAAAGSSQAAAAAGSSQAAAAAGSSQAAAAAGSSQVAAAARSSQAAAGSSQAAAAAGSSLAAAGSSQAAAAAGSSQAAAAAGSRQATMSSNTQAAVGSIVAAAPVNSNTSTAVGSRQAAAGSIASAAGSSQAAASNVVLSAVSSSNVSVASIVISAASINQASTSRIITKSVESKQPASSSVIPAAVSSSQAVTSSNTTSAAYSAVLSVKGTTRHNASVAVVSSQATVSNTVAAAKESSPVPASNVVLAAVRSKHTAATTGGSAAVSSSSSCNSADSWSNHALASNVKISAAGSSSKFLTEKSSIKNKSTDISCLNSTSQLQRDSNVKQTSSFGSFSPRQGKPGASRDFVSQLLSDHIYADVDDDDDDDIGFDPIPVLSKSSTKLSNQDLSSNSTSLVTSMSGQQSSVALGGLGRISDSELGTSSSSGLIVASSSRNSGFSDSTGSFVTCVTSVSKLSCDSTSSVESEAAGRAPRLRENRASSFGSSLLNPVVTRPDVLIPLASSHTTMSPTTTAISKSATTVLPSSTKPVAAVRNSLLARKAPVFSASTSRVLGFAEILPIKRSSSSAVTNSSPTTCLNSTVSSAINVGNQTIKSPGLSIGTVSKINSLPVCVAPQVTCFYSPFASKPFVSSLAKVSASPAYASSSCRAHSSAASKAVLPPTNTFVSTASTKAYTTASSNACKSVAGIVASSVVKVSESLAGVVALSSVQKVSTLPAGKVSTLPASKVSASQASKTETASTAFNKQPSSVAVSSRSNPFTIGISHNSGLDSGIAQAVQDLCHKKPNYWKETIVSMRAENESMKSLSSTKTNNKATGSRAILSNTQASKSTATVSSISQTDTNSSGTHVDHSKIITGRLPISSSTVTSSVSNHNQKNTAGAAPFRGVDNSDNCLTLQEVYPSPAAFHKFAAQRLNSSPSAESPSTGTQSTVVTPSPAILTPIVTSSRVTSSSLVASSTQMTASLSMTSSPIVTPSLVTSSSVVTSSSPIVSSNDCGPSPRVARRGRGKGRNLNLKSGRGSVAKNDSNNNGATCEPVDPDFELALKLQKQINNEEREKQKSRNKEEYGLRTRCTRSARK